MKLLEQIKEILYDIIGYLIPGFITLFLILPTLLYKESLIYFLYTQDLKLLLTNWNYDFSNYINTITILILIFICYILGHAVSNIFLFIRNIINCIIYKPLKKLFIYLPEKIKNILKFLLNMLTIRYCDKELNEKFNYLSTMKENLSEILSTNNKFYCYKLLLNNKDLAKKTCTTLASSFSRFTNHNDLIQKYIFKKTFFSSIKALCFFIYIDVIISSIITKNYLYGVVLFIISYLLFLVFYYEENRHNKLREKEEYLFLYHHIHQLENNSLSQNN